MSMTIPLSRRQAGALLVALGAALVSACGGGGEVPPPSSAGPSATAYAAGPISGFGSIIVNGVRYDDSVATVVDDDDAVHSRDGLKLGMMVEVDGHQVDRALAVGRALRIRFGSEIVGPVDAVDAAAGTLQVMGQQVVVNDTTVIDDSIAGGLAGIVPGDVLEVHARFDPALAVYTATRIEDKADARFFKLRGLMDNLDVNAETFTIGGEVIHYAQIPAAERRDDFFRNGQRVRVLLRTAQVDQQWIAVRMRVDRPRVDDRAQAQVRGTITAFTSLAAFEVNGLAVDASQARFPDGTNGVMLGAFVEVEGAIVNGVLVARKVELEAHHRHDDNRKIELHGLISALDTTARTFMLRGILVSYAETVVWKDGSEADLADGKRVEVKAKPSADRTHLVAQKIEFDS